jgi:hypothetical protein
MAPNVARYRNHYDRETIIGIIKERIEDLEDSQLENIANELGMGDFCCMYDNFVEHPYKNEVDSFPKIEKGDSVLVIPTLSNDFDNEFQATVVGFKKGEEDEINGEVGEDLVVVVDQDDYAHDVEPEGIVKDEG